MIQLWMLRRLTDIIVQFKDQNNNTYFIKTSNYKRTGTW